MMTDDELIRRMRDELDRLVDGVPTTPTAPPVADPQPSRRWMALVAAAAAVVVLVGGLVVVTGRDTGEDEVPSATVPPTAAPITGAPITVPPTTVEVLPPTSYVLAEQSEELETLGTVIDDGTGARLCFVVNDSLPPQCGSGIVLVDWSWDAIDVERVDSGTTWVDSIYLRGRYDRQANTFSVTETRPLTEADLDRLVSSAGIDFSVPCPEPGGGWPARNQEWPGDEIRTIDGYAGAWVDESQQVMTVKFTGDLAAAEAAVRQYYSDAICVVPAEHTEAELLDIQSQLLAMSSIQFSSSAVFVDATGEWVEATTFAPEPERQAAFDEQFGPGVVRLASRMHPIE